MRFQRTFISSYPNATQDTQQRLTAVCKNWGFGLEFTHCFVLLWSVIYDEFRLTKSPTSASHETLAEMAF
ncbi:hypothetical protein [Flavobacterium sp.]|uniref:hypothetical protein n=1 Tax=Flavobacterium sp. TaxID=239 RepID=UPI0037525E57